MPDMLVKLYELHERATAPEGVEVRRALAAEKHRVVAFARERWGDGWGSETEVAFSRDPVACLIAVADGKLAGFAVYDVTARGVFGPTGVDESARGRGIGRALLVETLLAMRAAGYAYAVIGWVGEARAFYERAVNAVVIPDSEPGMYRGLLRG
jgi:ribosomal protein S18 acetylase RimI-like enzyme